MYVVYTLFLCLQLNIEVLESLLSSEDPVAIATELAETIASM